MAFVYNQEGGIGLTVPHGGGSGAVDHADSEPVLWWCRLAAGQKGNVLIGNAKKRCDLDKPLIRQCLRWDND